MYANARYLIRGMPHSDEWADAEDLYHDAVVNVLERGVVVEDWPRFVGGMLPQFAVWNSHACGKANHRRHYGAQWLSRGEQGREQVGVAPLEEWTAPAQPAHMTAEMVSAAKVFGRACRSWLHANPAASWVPWAWILRMGYDWQGTEIGVVMGFGRRWVRTQLRQFEQLLAEEAAE